jgi:hypothetical protein
MSASAKDGFSRVGRVLRLGVKRVVIGYRFKNGRESTKAIPLGDVHRIVQADAGYPARSIARGMRAVSS